MRKWRMEGPLSFGGDIRLHSGSFIEFSKGGSAEFQVGTEIRNLHLGILTLFGGFDAQGHWEIHPQGFAIKGIAQTHSLYMNDYELEEGAINVAYEDGQ